MAKTKKKSVPHTIHAGAFFELLRPQNSAMAAIAVLIGFFLTGGINYISLILAMLSAFLICGGGQAANDFFDAKIDAKTSKHRPIPSERISKREALWFAVVLFLAGLMISLLINPPAALIAGIFSTLLIIYPAFMNHVKYLGNIVVALGTAITFVFGAASAGNIPLLIIILSASAFFSNMGREVTKDIEDLKKDKGTKTTLAMITPHARHFVTVYYSLSIVIALAAFFLFDLNYGYFALTFIAAVIFASALYLLYFDDAKESQKYSKTAMLISLIAFLLAIFRQ